MLTVTTFRQEGSEKSESLILEFIPLIPLCPPVQHSTPMLTARRRD
jgi:hypothetical protein